MKTIREGELFTSTENVPGLCLSLFILLCTNVISKWHSILDGKLRVVNTGQFNMSEASTAVPYCFPYPSLPPSHCSASSWAAHTHLWWPQQNSTAQLSTGHCEVKEYMLHNYKEQQKYLTKGKENLSTACVQKFN